MYYITPGYLQAMRTRLMAGRDLDQRDTKTRRVAMVNEAFVRQLLPGEDPVGKRFRHSLSGKWIQIAGVVEDGKYRSLGERRRPRFLTDGTELEPQQTLVARSPLAEAETARLLRRAVAELDPSLTVFDDGSLASALGLALFPAKLVAVVLASFGLLAVVLAATGVYGIMAYAVSRRTREIGIRMALGAAPFAGGARGADADGDAAGSRDYDRLRAGVRAGKFFGQILYGVSAHDPLTYLCAIALMALVAFLACWVPARRAIHLDPLSPNRVGRPHETGDARSTL
jgi:putative ABC transport system permease protein